MTPKQIEQATNKLVEATAQSATEAGTTAEARAAALAPELAGGSSLPGGYMYQRHIAPVVPALTADLVSQGRQQATRGAIRDALHTSSVALEKAQRAQRQRQRDFEAERHRRYEENARRQRARVQAEQNAIAALQSGGGGGNIGQVELIPSNASSLDQMVSKGVGLWNSIPQPVKRIGLAALLPSGGSSSTSSKSSKSSSKPASNPLNILSGVGGMFGR